MLIWVGSVDIILENSKLFVYSGGTSFVARFFEFLNYLVCSNAVSAKAKIGKDIR